MGYGDRDIDIIYISSNKLAMKRWECINAPSNLYTIVCASHTLMKPRTNNIRHPASS